MLFNSASYLALAAVSCISVAATSTIYFPPSETHHLYARNNDAEMIPRISGGEPVPNNDLKYVAFIQAVKDSMGSTCTGSLIAPNVVLTAAHCIYRNSTQLYAAKEFQVGFTHKTPDTSKKYQGYSVSKIVLLSSFNIATLKTDIAILVLSDNVPNDVASPVQIYSGDFNTDTPLLAAGFGMTNTTDSNSTPANLMEVSLKVGSDDYCKSKSGSYDHKVNICTDGTPGKDTCRGDSGGPLLTPVNNGSNKYALIGITSYTPVNAENPNGLCAQANSSGVYTRVAPYISWIAQYANLNATAISITNITATHSDSVVSSKSGASLNWLSSDLDPTDEVDSDNGDIFGEPSIIYASSNDSYTNDAKTSRLMLTTSIGYVAIGAVIAIIALV